MYYVGLQGEQMGGPGPQRLRILVVDDVADFVDTMGMFLQLAGHTVATAENGAGAILRAASFQPDVVLLDIGLGAVNGYETARRIKQQPGAAPVIIAISGRTRAQDRERARETGFDHYLTKPVDFQELTRLLSLRQTPGASQV